MAQKGFASNNSLNMDSFLHVDKEIEFIVDDSSSQYSFAVPTEKTLELSRKTYSKKNPITYHHYSSSPDKMQVNGNTSVTNTCILNQRNSPVEQKKLLRGKRSKDSHPINSKSMPPKRMKRKETNDIKIIHHKINVPKSSNKFYKGVSNSNLVVDPDIEIIEVKQNSPKSRSVGLLETNITVTPNYCSAKGKAKDKLDILQKKKNPLKMVPQPISEPCYPSNDDVLINEADTAKGKAKDKLDILQKKKNPLKMVPQPVSEPCYPSNDEVLINEADTAPIMPSSDIPDGTVIEASNSMINASTSRKWLSADGTVRFSQLNSDSSPAAKGAKKDGGKILLPSQKKFEKSRELRRLYNNLNEISWFHEKSFQKLLVNKKGHIQPFDKNLRHIKSALLHRLKRQPMKKSAAKIVALKKTKIARLKHKVPAKRLPFKQVNKKVLASKQISKTNTIKQNMNVIKKHGTSNLRTKKHIINQNNNKKIQNMKKGMKINSISKKYINAEIRKKNIKKGVKIDKGKQYINARIKKENNNAGIKKRDINAKNKKENVSTKSKKENVSTKSKKENSSSNAKKNVNASPKKLIAMHIGNKKDNVLNTSDKKKVVTSSEKKINSASTSGKKISITAPLMKKANAVTPIMKKTSVNISDKKLTAATNFKLNNTDPKNNIKKSKVMPKIVYRGKNTTVPSSRMDFSVASGSGLQNACNIFKTDVCSSNPSASLLKNMYKNLEKVEISNEVDIYRRFISGEKEIYSAFQRGSKLRVTLEPLEHTDWWTDECYESVKKEMLQQALLKAVEKKDQESINAMFRELHESCINPQNNNKVTKRKRPEEEALRSSVRQSEGAFRYKEIVVKKHTNYMQFVLVPNPSKQNSLTIEAMKELKDAFLLAKRDSNCKAVLLNSSGSYFCSGIDLSQLIGANKKQAADEMATTIKDLVITLGHFTKPVIAAVNGTTIGFGVSLLTFCDVILASDKATFSIPATRLGYLPEGGITLTLPQLVGAGVATEMLLHGRRLTAEQALRHGLVSEVLWPTHLMNEVMPRIQTIVSQPLSVMETLKSMVRCHLWDKLKSHLERECRLLPPFWLDAQCQHNIKRTLQTGWLVD